MDKNYDTTLWARDPNGGYHLLQTSSTPISYTFSIGSISLLPYNSEPTGNTNGSSGNNVVLNFALPEAENAYQIAVNQGFSGSESEWLYSLKGQPGEQGPQGVQGPQGIQGLQGLQGSAGLGLTNKGTWVSGNTYSQGDYVFATTNKNDGGTALYAAISEDPFESTIEPENDTNNWSEVYAPQGPQGPQGIQGIQGTQGETGDNGKQGPQGLSAYQVAINNGFSGTETEWLESLKGDSGTAGQSGNSIKSISLNITKS